MDTTYYLSKRTNQQNWSDWLDSKGDEWELLTFTVVFQLVYPDCINTKARWEDEYRQRILSKFKRRLERNRAKRSNAIPFEHLFYFEREEASVHKRTRSRKVPHIHALIPIKKKQFHRVWSTERAALDETLKRDLASVKTVQSIDCELIRSGMTVDWIRYISKQKEF